MHRKTRPLLALVPLALLFACGAAAEQDTAVRPPPPPPPPDTGDPEPVEGPAEGTGTVSSPLDPWQPTRHIEMQGEGVGDESQIRLEPSSGLAAAAIGEATRPRRDDMRRCWDAWLLRAPEPPRQSTVLRVTVTPDGSVADASLVDDSVGDDEFRRCVLDGARSLSFPRSDAATVFTWPIEFDRGRGLNPE